MMYLTGKYALNLKCNLNTMGDWHWGCYDWNNIETKLVNSDNSIFKDYGIEKQTNVFDNIGKEIFVANHIRACLDMLEKGNTISPQGMNKDYIGNSKYDTEIFNKVYMLKSNPNWNKIKNFMLDEYGIKWIKYLKGCEH